MGRLQRPTRGYGRHVSCWKQIFVKGVGVFQQDTLTLWVRLGPVFCIVVSVKIVQHCFSSPDKSEW